MLVLVCVHVIAGENGEVLEPFEDVTVEVSEFSLHMPIHLYENAYTLHA